MPRITEQQAGGLNVLAFLDMIAWSEGTSTSPATRDNGYDVIVTGFDGKPETFTDYSDHPFAKSRPSKTINRTGLTSNASGRYQQMKKDWPHYKTLLKLADFGPLNQDRLAIQHIKECRALPDVIAGRFEAAVIKCRNIWASLPGAGYGQREHRLDDLMAQYKAVGGALA